MSIAAPFETPGDKQNSIVAIAATALLLVALALLLDGPIWRGIWYRPRTGLCIWRRPT